jgi:DNA topoisomerase-1
MSPAGEKSPAAHRVTESVALRLICDREDEIDAFKPREYWSVAVTLEPPNGGRFIARVVGFDGKRINRLDIPDEAMARRVEAALKSDAYRVVSVEAKSVRRNPPPPFTTSTLQQEASRKLGFAANRTMQVAQRLYEDGIITYMRTDGVDIAPEALAATRRAIASQFGERYLPEHTRRYTAKAKNAQEAHEAIRPTDFSRTPDPLGRSLEQDQARLCELIWKRTMASQMQAAELERTTIEIAGGHAGEAALRAIHQVVRFDGFLALSSSWPSHEISDSPKEGDPLKEHGFAVEQHFTEPPPRYT